MACPQCNGQDCTRIEIHLKGEQTIHFYSCRSCETKWWEDDAGVITLDEALSLAAEDAGTSSRIKKADRSDLENDEGTRLA